MKHRYKLKGIEKRTMEKLFIALLVMMLIGCANQQYRQEQWNQQAKKNFDAANKQCDDKAKIMEPYFSSIKNKIRIPIQPELTLDMLSNTQYAHDSEKHAIEKLNELSEYCFTALKNWATSTFNAEYGEVFTEQITLHRENASHLYSGKITYGEYNKKADEISKLRDQRLIALDAKYREIAMKQQFIQQQAQQLKLNNSINLMNMGIQMMTPPQPSMRNINCHQMGIYTNCQSW